MDGAGGKPSDRPDHFDDKDNDCDLTLRRAQVGSTSLHCIHAGHPFSASVHRIRLAHPFTASAHRFGLAHPFTASV